MIITLTPEESLDYFYNSLCNAVGSGYMSGYGLELDYDDKQYKLAKEKLINENKSTCLEDVWIQILKNGGSLTFTDIEGDEDPVSIVLADVYERVAKTPIRYLTDMITENDDATTADIILQTVFFEKVIYG